MSKVRIKIRLNDAHGTPGAMVVSVKDPVDKKRKLTVNEFRGKPNCDIEVQREDNYNNIDKTDATAWNDVRGTTPGQFAPQAIDSLRIEGKVNDYLVTKIERLIYLKREIMDFANGTNPAADVQSEIVKRVGAAGDVHSHWTFTLRNIKDDRRLKRDGATKLVLEDSIDYDSVNLSSGGSLANLIDINEWNQTANGTAPVLEWDFSPAQKALEDLEKLLENLYKKFGKRQQRRSSAESWVWYAEKISGTLEQTDIKSEAEKLEEYSIYEGVGKNLVFTDKIINNGKLTGTGKATKNFENNKIKSLLYHLESGNHDRRLYKGKIDTWMNYLLELFSWRGVGFTDNHEILIIHRLGFTNDDIDDFKNKKFMGFPVLIGKDGKNLEIEKAPVGTTNSTYNKVGENGFQIKGSLKRAKGYDGNTSFNIETYVNPNINYVQGGTVDFEDRFGQNHKRPANHIRALRTLEVKTGGTNTEPFWDSGGKSIFADQSKTSRADLFGYQPQDICFSLNPDGSGKVNVFDATGAKIHMTASNSGTGEATGGINLKDGRNWIEIKKGDNNAAMFDHITTRVKRDASSWNSMNGAIRLAFTGWCAAENVFFHQLEAEIPSSLNKKYNQSHANKVAILGDYYDFIKGISVSVFKDDKYIEAGKTYGGFASNSKTQKAVDNLDRSYTEALKWAKIWDTTYDGSSDKTQAKNDQTYLGSILTQTSTDDSPEQNIRYWIQLNPVWRKAVAEKQTEINNAISSTPFTPSPGPVTIADIDKALTDSGVSGAKAQEIFAKAKIESPLPTKEVLEKLKTLAKLLEEVHKGTKKYDDAHSTLESFKKDTGDKKKAWDIAEKVDDGGKGYATTALEKLEGELTKARADAKDELGDEAHTAIGIDQETSVKTIQKIVQIFKAAKEAWGQTGFKEDSTYNTPNKITELKGYQKDDSSEWGKVNKHKHSGKDYATGALEKLEGFSKKHDKNINDLKNKTTGNEVMTEWKKSSKSVSEDDAKRIAGYVHLKNGSTQEEKELSGLLGNKSSTNDFSDTSDDDYNAINDLISKLKSYKDASDSDAKGKARKKLEEITDISDSKAVLDSWIRKLEERQKVLEQKYEERKKQGPQEDTKGTKFWTSVPAIIIYCVLAACIIGGLIWLAFKGGSEEDEGEQE